MVGFRPPLHGIYERRRVRTKIQRRQSPAVGGFQKRLIFRPGEQQLVFAIAVIVEHFDASDLSSGNKFIRSGLGANQVSPKLSAEMRSVQSAKNTMPIGIVALRAEKLIASRGNFLRRFGFRTALWPRRQPRSGAQHFLVQKVRLRIFTKKSAPRTAPQ